MRLANSLVADATEIDLLAIFNKQGDLCGFNSRRPNGDAYPPAGVEKIYDLSFASREIVQHCLRGASAEQAFEFQHECDFRRPLTENDGTAIAYSVPIRDPANGAIIGAASVRLWFDRIAALLPDEPSVTVTLVSDTGAPFLVPPTADAAATDESGIALPPDTIVSMVDQMRAAGISNATFAWRNYIVEIASASAIEALERGKAYVIAYADEAWITQDARQERMTVALGALAGALLLFAGTAIAYGLYLRKLGIELESNRLAAESASSAKSSFLAHMSHEIRTPITAVLGYLELLSGADSPGAPARPTKSEMIEIASRNARFLLCIIDDLLDLSRIEAGNFVAHYSWVRPTDTARNCIAALSATAAAKGVVLRLDDSVSEPPEMCTDGVRLRQILTNLVSNAVKFTSVGEVVLTVRSAGASAVEFRVRDTGCGIDMAHSDRLFVPFSQLDARPNRSHTGTGLGLVITKHYAERLGGSIVLDSMPGRGTTVIVRLPSRPEQLPKIAATTAPPAELSTASTQSATMPLVSAPIHAASGRLREVRVLVTDDYDSNRDLMRYHLESASAIVTLACDGSDAIRKIESAQTPFDVVPMDMQMPILDGYDATASLRAKGYAGVIIAMTAHAMLGEREKCLAAGCDDYISKPVTADELITKVATHATVGLKPR